MTGPLLGELEDTLGCDVICGYGLTEASPQLTKALTLRSHDDVAIVRWTTTNPGGDDDHYSTKMKRLETYSNCRGVINDRYSIGGR